MSITATALSAFQDALPISSIVWKPARRDQVSGLGLGGALTYDMGGQLWSGTVMLDSMKWAEARDAHARIFALEGPTYRFLFTNPLAPAPASDPTGAGLSGKTVTIGTINADGRSLTFAGLAANYALGWGDMWSIDFGSPTMRGLFSINGPIAANSGGTTGLFKSTPALWPGIVAGATVNLLRPSAVCFIMPNTLQVGALRNGKVDGASFDIMQVLG